jgi:cyclopropane fatty-acyl-phospholipid synthase-like methyltransferase
MSNAVDLYNSTYSNFQRDVLAAIRQEAFGQDIGQNSWITVDEYQHFFDQLNLDAGAHVLEVACGSGGPALHLAHTRNCRITGVDVNIEGVAEAQRAARHARIADAQFCVADMNKTLPQVDATFDGMLCIDSLNHFRDRLHVMREWRRVLKPGSRCVFTDPVVITGPVSNEELAARSNIGFFLFVPPAFTERCIEEAGFTLIQREDATDNIAMTSQRWHAARQRHREALLEIEGLARFDALQTFFAAVHLLSAERRLSRFAWIMSR